MLQDAWDKINANTVDAYFDRTTTLGSLQVRGQESSSLTTDWSEFTCVPWEF